MSEAEGDQKPDREVRDKQQTDFVMMMDDPRDPKVVQLSVPVGALVDNSAAEVLIRGQLEQWKVFLLRVYVDKVRRKQQGSGILAPGNGAGKIPRGLH